MKKSLILIFILTILSTQAAIANKISSDCTYKGVKLYGKVKVVNSFEDFKVKQVSSFEDIKVKKVSSFPNKCGQWQYVNSFPDFKIKYVDSFEDFKVKYVDSFEGI